MNTYINYLIEANLGLIVFLVFYVLLLRKETNFNFKRVYLLVSIAASLLFPLANIQSLLSVLTSISNVVPYNLLPVTGVAERTGLTVPMIEATSLWLLMMWMYVLISGALLLVFLKRLMKLLILFRKSFSIIYSEKYHLIESSRNVPTFSFFNYIFVGNADQLSIQEKNQIIAHEIIHAKELHSADILLAELLKIFFWFNPVAYYFKSILSSLHEFQADQLAIDHHHVDEYCGLLAKATLQSVDFPLANHFNNSLTLKRIAMMKAVKTKVHGWKMAAIAPLFIGLFVFVACQDQIVENQNEPLPSSLLNENMPVIVKTRLQELQQIYPTSNFVVIERTAEGNETLKQIWKRKDIGIFQSFSLFEGENNETMINRDFMIVELTDRKIRRASLPRNEKDIFTQVDEPASPVLGIDQFYKRISQVLTYPEESRIRGTEGRVILEFLVETDGNISDIKVIKGIDEYLDAEAIRVLLQAGSTWDPAIHHGQVVKQKIALPINFTLKDSRKTIK